MDEVLRPAGGSRLEGGDQAFRSAAGDRLRSIAGKEGAERWAATCAGVMKLGDARRNQWSRPVGERRRAA